MKYLDEYGATAILVTHYLDEVKEYANSVLLLHRGKLIFDGTPRDLLDRLGYRYRARMKLANDKILKELPSRRYTQRGSEVEVFVSDDNEFIALIRFIEARRDYVTEFVVERPSLEESYTEMIRLDKDVDARHTHL